MILHCPDVKESGEQSIHISVARQRLAVKRGRKTERAFPISTSKYGLGSEEGSMKTPVGRFRVAEKIGAGQPIDIAYKARVPVCASADALKSDDLIMSRILWLEGLDAGNANTHARYIYIHGTNHEDQIGTPASHGCIRMKNAEMAELFELVEVGTPVVIAPPPLVSRAGKKRQKSIAQKK
ncbi:MAG TPA: L,D-transpeptidase [Chthoniobacterales bacterium]|nr:L,D-transpeptidase [Chthoniobacterales bacterium]